MIGAISFSGVENKQTTRLVDYGAKDKDLVHIPLLYEEPVDTFENSSQKEQEKKSKWEHVINEFLGRDNTYNTSTEFDDDFNKNITEILKSEENKKNDNNQVKEAPATEPEVEKSFDYNTDFLSHFGVKSLADDYDHFEAFDRERSLNTNQNTNFDFEDDDDFDF